MNKYCPYRLHIEQVTQNMYEYDSDGRNTFHEHKLIEDQQNTLCTGKQCGAYWLGRCHYKG